MAVAVAVAVAVTAAWDYQYSMMRLVRCSWCKALYEVAAMMTAVTTTDAFSWSFGDECVRRCVLGSIWFGMVLWEGRKPKRKGNKTRR